MRDMKEVHEPLRRLAHDWGSEMSLESTGHGQVRLDEAECEELARVFTDVRAEAREEFLEEAARELCETCRISPPTREGFHIRPDSRYQSGNEIHECKAVKIRRLLLKETRYGLV